MNRMSSYSKDINFSLINDDKSSTWINKRRRKTIGTLLIRKKSSPIVSSVPTEGSSAKEDGIDRQVSGTVLYQASRDNFCEIPGSIHQPEEVLSLIRNFKTRRNAISEESEETKHEDNAVIENENEMVDNNMKNEEVAPSVDTELLKFITNDETRQSIVVIQERSMDKGVSASDECEGEQHNIFEVPSQDIEPADVASMVIELGAIMLGDVVSTIVTVWVALAELPDVSTTVHSIVVSPSVKNLAGCSVIEVIPIMSYPVASPNSIMLPDRLVASATISAGTKISGDVVSINVTV